MPSHLESDDRELLFHLQGQGATIQDLCTAEGVTATAVRHRLSRLQLLGLVDRESVRSGRGRPKHLYRLTDLGFRQLGENYADLAMLLWRAVQEIEDDGVRAGVLDRVRETMVQRYGGRSSGGSLASRFELLGASLSAHGFDVEVDDDGELPILRERSCPYHELATHDSGICDLEREVMESVVGTPLKQTQCCLDGEGSCEFTPVPDAAKP